MPSRVDNETIKQACEFARNYYRDNNPEDGSHASHLGAEAIREAGKHYGIGFGSEGFSQGGGESITYLNMGDTYDFTVIFDSLNEEFFTSDYGTVREKLEAEGAI